MYKNLKILTSNKSKIKEYKEFGLNMDIESGEDQKEIDSTDYHLIAAHKAFNSGLYTIVEDTILIVNGDIWHDIKFKREVIPNNMEFYLNKPISWIVSLSFMTEDYIYVFEGSIDGFIGEVYNSNCDVFFDFDLYVHVEHNNRLWSLQELKDKNMKSKYSARKFAIESLLSFISGDSITYVKKFNSNLPLWNGNYQS
jgi:inosine/xanthosine triphosphate pyrophosphatase family protein